MTGSTIKFLVLHIMVMMLVAGCLLVASRGGDRVLFYFPAGMLLMVAIGTLRDFLRYYKIDLIRQG